MTTSAPASIAICDSLLLMNAIFADEAAYRAKDISARLEYNPGALTVLTSASLIFDQLVQVPLMVFGLQPIIGYRFLDVFGLSIKKLTASGFVTFDLEARIPDEIRPKRDKIQAFLQEVNKAEYLSSITGKNGPKKNIFQQNLDQLFLDSRATQLPLVATAHILGQPRIGQSPLVSTPQKQFEMLQTILTFEVPTLHVETLDDIVNIRATSGAKEFREFFREFYSDIMSDEGRILSGDILNTNILARWNSRKNEGLDLLVNEFKTDITGWQVMRAGGSILLDLAGFIPIVSGIAGAISAANDSVGLIETVAKRRRANEVGWLTFLADIRKRRHHGPHAE